MWVYVKTEPQLWTVGYYAPGGEFHTDSDHGSKEEAAERVHYLNGGSDEDDSEGVELKLRPRWNPRYAVIYPDGQQSLRMDKKDARGYARVFGGKLICVRPKENLILRIIKKIKEL